MPKKLANALLITGFLATGLALASSPAQANPTLAVDVAPDPDRRTEIDVGMLVGGSDIGEQQRSTYGLHVNLGQRFGDFALLGEYNYLAIGKPSSESRGSMNRFGLVARYSLLRTSSKIEPHGKRGPVSGDYWLEAGAGIERLSWDAGGTLTRPDIILGFGWQLNAVIGRKSDTPRYYGPYIAFRAKLARAPESDDRMPVTCGGPCDTQTGPSSNDVSMFFHFGFNWSR